MTDFVSILLITLPLISWGFIVNSQSLRKKWLYVLFTFIIFWGIVRNTLTRSYVHCVCHRLDSFIEGFLLPDLMVGFSFFPRCAWSTM